jgi:16S rRNA U516 pseudouridylate synthase RsuA-like enzyme
MQNDKMRCAAGATSIHRRRNKRHFVLNKPPLCLCSTVDNQPQPKIEKNATKLLQKQLDDVEEHLDKKRKISREAQRRTVYTYLDMAGFPSIGCVGRLDYDTSGLLLFTDDAELNYACRDKNYCGKEEAVGLKSTAPIAKVYEVDVAGSWSATDAPICLLSEPLLYPKLGKKGADIWTDNASCELLSVRTTLLPGELDPWPWPPHGGAVTCLRFTLCEGRKRQIRQLCKRSKLHVRRLHRVQYGPLQLDEELPMGHCRWLSNEEAAALYIAAMGAVPAQGGGTPATETKKSAGDGKEESSDGKEESRDGKEESSAGEHGGAEKGEDQIVECGGVANDEGEECGGVSKDEGET